MGGVRRTRWGATVVRLVVTIALGVAVLLVPSPAWAGHQYLWWNEDGASHTDTAAVTVHKRATFVSVHAVPGTASGGAPSTSSPGSGSGSASGSRAAAGTGSLWPPHR